MLLVIEANCNVKDCKSSDIESTLVRIQSSCTIGMWLRLVEHLVWDQGVAGSNPVIPIK